MFQLVLMFVANYYQSNVIACVGILTPKHSFCNTVCVCMVMQIKLVVELRWAEAGFNKTFKLK